MRVLIQRVTSASVSIGGEVYHQIGKGLCVLVGVEDADTEDDLDYLVGKISRLRIFQDDAGKMNLSVREIGGEILLISQFTLYADTRKGNRPSFIASGRPEKAEQMYEAMCRRFREIDIPTFPGVFGADMLVGIQNDGPVTIWMDSRQR